MAIRAGEMRHRVRIEQRVTTQDTSGEPEHTWELLAETWAGVEQFPGRERLSGEQRLARQPTRFRLRFVGGVTPDMRVVWGERVYDIRDVHLPRGISYRGAEMVLTAEELVGEPP
ncbi:MAG: head-tail adaptor protein [Deltaproteobacteria bacterium]